MNSIKQILLTIIGVLFLTTCQKIETLKRDNPLDANGDGGGVGGGTIIGGVALKFDSYSVVEDNNGDKIVNKGETVYLKVNLKNSGSSKAYAVMASFATTSSYVSGFSPTTQIDYDDIAAGGIQGYSYGTTGYVPGSYNSYTIKFTVSNTTPANTKIPINITMVDESDNTWTDSFEVTVEATQAQIGFSSYSVVEDNNGDKIVNKGETVYLKVNLKNSGSSKAKAVMASFATTSSYVSGFSPTTKIGYDDIVAGGIQGYSYGTTGYVPGSYNSYTIKFTVSNTTPANTKIPISITIVDESDNTWTDSFEVTVEDMQAQIGFSSYSVVEDNNSDKIVNKGETVYLKVNLKNSGSSTAKAVMAAFSTTSSYVSGFSPTTKIDYDDIAAGGIQGYSYGTTGYVPGSYNSYTIKFTVSNTTPANTKIPISITIVDESDNTWTDSFEVTVEATQAQIGFSSYSVVGDNNGDKIVNKGETVYLKVNLKNNGSSKAKAVMAAFSTTSSYVSGFSPTTKIDYDDIAAGGIQGYSYGTTGYVPGSYNSYTIQFTVSNSTPTGTQIPISISIVDESDNTWSDSFNVPVQ